jgi:predicted lipid-binding transport protein (Tim44 family)
MKTFLLVLFATAFSFTFVSTDAEAKRLGGARSSGMSRDATVMKRDAAPVAPAQQSAVPAKPQQAAPAAAPQPSGMSRWLGPLAGIAAGLGLAALLSHFGLGEGFASMMMIALLVFAAIFVVRMLMRNRNPQPAMQYSGSPGNFEPVSMPVDASASATGSTTAASVPVGFDTEGFLRQAKLNFVRLQAANDAGNLEDIRLFTTPEMYAEIKLQSSERTATSQVTDVVKLEASLLDFTTETNRAIATVRFSGLISEEAGAPAAPFDEAWHLTRPLDGSSGWVISGIQQFQ